MFSRRCTGLLSASLFFGFFLVLLLPEVSLAQRRCDTFPEAEARYLEGDFVQAIELVSECLNQGLAGEEAVRPYRLLTLAYINQGELEQAKLTLVKLLGQAPGYEPDPVEDPPSYTALFNVVKQQLQLAAIAMPPDEAAPAPRRKRSWLASPVTWITIGGGALVTTVVVYILSGGNASGEQRQPLPLPPGLP